MKNAFLENIQNLTTFNTWIRKQQFLSRVATNPKKPKIS